MLPGAKIHWVRDQVPVDEPLCGYRGQNCIPPPSKLSEMLPCYHVVIIFVVNMDNLFNWPLSYIPRSETGDPSLTEIF